MPGRLGWTGAVYREGVEFSVRDSLIASQGLDTGGRRAGVWPGCDYIKAILFAKKTLAEAKFSLVQDCIIAWLPGLWVLKAGNETRGREFFVLSVRK